MERDGTPLVAEAGTPRQPGQHRRRSDDVESRKTVANGRRWRRLLALLTVALLASLGLAGIGTPAQADAGGWRSIRNAGNGKCIDNALENKSKIQIWSCVNGNPNDQLPEGMEQMWTLVPTLDEFNRPAYFIRNRLSGRCMGGINHVDPQYVTGNLCYAQRDAWQVIYENWDSGGWYQVLQSPFSGLCLDLTDNSSANGTLIEQYYCDYSFTNLAQRWRLGTNVPYDGGVPVPAVLGYGEQAAVDIVNRAGLVATTVHQDDCASPGDVEVVSPSGGSYIPPGSTVRLTVSVCSGIPK